MSFMIETSARHIHLTQETVEKLFGKGYELTIRREDARKIALKEGTV